MTSSALDTVARLRIIPVVEIEEPSRAPALGEALLSAGLPCAEITFRTTGAAEAITRLRRACPGLVVGAGTVLTIEQVDAAADAGAEFLVAPGYNPRVVDYAVGRGAFMVPGVCTPTEIEAAVGRGLSVLKFFPAEIAGGPAFLKAVASVYQDVRFIPTGGINPGNLAAYLSLPNVVACGGSWMVRKDLIAAGRFSEIVDGVREAMDLVRTLTVVGASQAAGAAR